MQPSDSQLSGVPQTIAIDPNTGLPQNVIFIEEPSPASNIVGILVDNRNAQVCLLYG